MEWQEVLTLLFAPAPSEELHGRNDKAMESPAMSQGVVLHRSCLSGVEKAAAALEWPLASTLLIRL